MTQIDWSKAPADATHYHPRAGGYTDHWIKPGHFCVVGFEAKGWVSDFGHPAMKLAVPRPIAWNGEGAPPIGILLEVKLKGTRDTNRCPATVLFCQDDALVFAWKAEGVARPTTLSAVDIRPIRTAEQLAAEEREKAIDAMLNHSPVGRSPFAKDFCGSLYDAGARMPGEGPKA